MRSNRRNGLTLLEVIFAMVVILVGLVAVGLLIPLAGRQAADSYQITQGLAAGESALAVFNSTNVVQPSVESPWCSIDDVASRQHSLGSMQQAYDRIAETFPAPNDFVMAAVAQNAASGIGFCIDPLFWGYQEASNSVPLPFFRTRFPFVYDKTNLNLMVSNDNLPRGPRLLRCSLSDPTQVVGGGWLRQPAAVRLATMYGGDLVQPATGKNKAIGPLRSVYVAGEVGNPIISSPTSPQQTSWLMTVTPSDNTPVISANLAYENWLGSTVLSNRPAQIPRLFDVALVVFSRRDTRELKSTIVMSMGDATSNTPSQILNVPSGERVFDVTDISPEALSSGSFDVTIRGFSGIDNNVKIGDWLMMSRFSYLDIPPRRNEQRPSSTFARQVHRWYRVVGVQGNDSVSKTVRLIGKPWNWTDAEIEMMKAYPNVYGDPINSNPFPPKRPPNASFPVFPFDTPVVTENRPPVVQAVLLKDVVHVYERQVELR